MSTIQNQNDRAGPDCEVMLIGTIGLTAAIFFLDSPVLLALHGPATMNSHFTVQCLHAPSSIRLLRI